MEYMQTGERAAKMVIPSLKMQKIDGNYATMMNATTAHNSRPQHSNMMRGSVYNQQLGTPSGAGVTLDQLTIDYNPNLFHQAP